MTNSSPRKWETLCPSQQAHLIIARHLRLALPEGEAMVRRVCKLFSPPYMPSQAAKLVDNLKIWDEVVVPVDIRLPTGPEPVSLDTLTVGGKFKSQLAGCDRPDGKAKTHHFTVLKLVAEDETHRCFGVLRDDGEQEQFWFPKDDLTHRACHDTKRYNKIAVA